MHEGGNRLVLSTHELEPLLSDPRTLLLDVRWGLEDPGAGRAAYRAGHLPRALYVDLEADLSTRIPRSGGRCPPRSGWPKLSGGSGSTTDLYVVAYDDDQIFTAARVVWMLAVLGHDRAALLDGGLPAWVAAGGELETTNPPPRPPGRLIPSPRPHLRRERAEVEVAVGAGTPLLDCRMDSTWESAGAHIPGARRLPAPALTDPHDGRLEPPAATRERLGRLGLGEDDEVILTAAAASPPPAPGWPCGAPASSGPRSTTAPGRSRRRTPTCRARRTDDGRRAALQRAPTGVRPLIWEAQLRHPFIQGIADGSLSEERFREWLRQDYLYLLAYVRVAAAGVMRAPDEATMKRFSETSHRVLGMELDLHRGYAAEFGLSLAELENAVMNPATQAYSDHLMRTATLGELPRSCRRPSSPASGATSGSAKNSPASRCRRIRATRAGSSSIPRNASGSSPTGAATSPTSSSQKPRSGRGEPPNGPSWSARATSSSVEQAWRAGE